MRYFNIFAFKSEKKDVEGRQRFLARFAFGPFSRFKNLSGTMNVTRSASRILLRGRGLELVPKLSNLAPSVTTRTIVQFFWRCIFAQL